MNKLPAYVLIGLLLLGVVIALPKVSIYEIQTSLSGSLGEENVTVLNSRQAVYFYETVMTDLNESLVEEFDEELNQTINVTVSNPFDYNAYVAAIVDINVGFDFYRVIISMVRS